MWKRCLPNLQHFLNLAAEFHIEEKQQMIDFKTSNPAIARRFLQLTRALYDVKTMLLTQENLKLSKKQSIIVRINSGVSNIINEHSFFDNPVASQKLITQDPKK